MLSAKPEALGTRDSSRQGAVTGDCCSSVMTPIPGLNVTSRFLHRQDRKQDSRTQNCEAGS